MRPVEVGRIIPQSFCKSIFEPLDRTIVAVDEHRIEAALRRARDACKIMARGAQQLRLLRRGDACRGAAKTLARAHAYFDEYEGSAFARNQIDFSEPAAVIAFDHFQARALQIRGCELF